MGSRGGGTDRDPDQVGDESEEHGKEAISTRARGGRARGEAAPRPASATDPRDTPAFESGVRNGTYRGFGPAEHGRFQGGRRVRSRGTEEDPAGGGASVARHWSGRGGGQETDRPSRPARAATGLADHRSREAGGGGRDLARWRGPSGFQPPRDRLHEHSSPCTPRPRPTPSWKRAGTAGRSCSDPERGCRRTNSEFLRL